MQKTWHALASRYMGAAGVAVCPWTGPRGCFASFLIISREKCKIEVIFKIQSSKCSRASNWLDLNGNLPPGSFPGTHCWCWSNKGHTIRYRYVFFAEFIDVEILETDIQSGGIFRLYFLKWYFGEISVGASFEIGQYPRNISCSYAFSGNIKGVRCGGVNHVQWRINDLVHLHVERIWNPKKGNNFFTVHMMK